MTTPTRRRDILATSTVAAVFGALYAVWPELAAAVGFGLSGAAAYMRRGA